LKIAIIPPIHAQADLSRDSGCAQAGSAQQQYQPDPAQDLGELRGECEKDDCWDSRNTACQQTNAKTFFGFSETWIRAFSTRSGKSSHQVVNMAG